MNFDSLTQLRKPTAYFAELNYMDRENQVCGLTTMRFRRTSLVVNSEKDIPGTVVNYG